MVSLAKAVPGVINAFAIMLIVMCIYAIIAVEFFAEFGKDGYYNSTVKDQSGNTYRVEIDSGTARGFFYGDEYYGQFDRALYTLWQVLTGESWSEAVARPLIFGSDSNWADANNPIIASFFFVSFLMINAIVLINVVVAVLLEKMVSDDPVEEEDGSEEGADDVTYLNNMDGQKNGIKVDGQLITNGHHGAADVARLEARLDRLDARFDEQQRLLEQILGALEVKGGGAKGGVKVEDY